MNNAGLISLSGFAFQVRAFIYYLSQLEEGESVNFEILEDVSITPQNIDSKNSSLKIEREAGVKVIQVKKSNLSKADMKKILKNWLILEYGAVSISEYHLVLSGSMDGELFASSLIDGVYQDVSSTKKRRKDSLDGQLEGIIKNKGEFDSKISGIKSKYTLINKDLEEKILEGFAIHFRRANNEVIFKNRIEELFRQITYEIIEKANNREPYILNYVQFIKLIEEITLTHTEKHSEPSYVGFKKLHPIDLADKRITTSREYLQLMQCELVDRQVKSQLIYGLYFQNAYILNMELSYSEQYKNLLETSFENFEATVDELGDRDTPKERLFKTQEKSNSYAPNEQIRKGSYIYLTRDDEHQRRISWKED